jgi:hypothetical protein
MTLRKRENERILEIERVNTRPYSGEIALEEATDVL